MEVNQSVKPGISGRHYKFLLEDRCSRSIFLSIQAQHDLALEKLGGAPVIIRALMERRALVS